MTTRPNVIVILADDMGFSDLGCYGSEIATPNLDRLATEGVRLNQFYNTARCSPSRASLLTGRYPHETGIGILTEDERPHGYSGDLSSEHETAAEHFKRAGYATCLSGKWHLTSSMTTPSDSWPTRRGFDDFYGIIGGAGDFFHPRGLYRGEEKLDPPTGDYYFTEAVGEHAVSFVEKQAAEKTPFFLYLAFTAPHWPLHAPEAEIERYRGVFDKGWDALREERLSRLIDSGIMSEGTRLSDRDPTQPAWGDEENKEWQLRRMAVYAAQVTTMDTAIGRLLDSLEQSGVADDTLVIFLSDNGASSESLPPDDAPFFRQRQPTHTLAGEPIRIGNDTSIWPGDESTFSAYGPAWANLSNTPFRLYKRWVHEGGIATPLIARWPNGDLAAGNVVRDAFQLTDILPTLLDAAAAPPAGGPGISMLGSWRGGREPVEHPLFWEHIGNCAVRVGDWKAVRAANSPWELYNLALDRSELDDLALVEPVRFFDLIKVWEEWADRVGVIPWDTYGQPQQSSQQQAGNPRTAESTAR